MALIGFSKHRTRAVICEPLLKTLPAATILNKPNPATVHNKNIINQLEIVASTDMKIEWGMLPINMNALLAAKTHKLNCISIYNKPSELVVSAMAKLISRSSPLIYLSTAELWLMCS